MSSQSEIKDHARQSNHCLITGGSSGIGLAVARLAVSRGDNVTLIARDKNRLDKARLELMAFARSEHQAVSTRVADVTNVTAVKTVIDQAIEQFGSPSRVILSAGIVSPGYFSDLNPDDFEHDMSVNYFGSLNIVRAVLPSMKVAATGQILFVGSGAGLVGVFGYSAYSPSKFAVRGLAEVLRAELKGFGIRVSIVYPPDTQTPQLDKELLVRPAETSAIAGKAKVWTADDVACSIMMGLDKRRFVIAPGLEMKALAVLHSLIAPLLFRIFDKAAASRQQNQK